MAMPREAINQRRALADTDWQFKPPLLRVDIASGVITEGNIDGTIGAVPITRPKEGVKPKCVGTQLLPRRRKRK